MAKKIRTNTSNKEWVKGRPAVTTTPTAAAVGSSGAPLSPHRLLPKGNAKTEEELEGEDDEELGESFSERLRGLMELFLEKVQSTAKDTFDLSLFVAEKNVQVFQGSCVDWDTFLVFPVFFETEVANGTTATAAMVDPSRANRGWSGRMPGLYPHFLGDLDYYC